MRTKGKVLIIGSGPAGYTAAIYAARANLKPVQVLGSQSGGQLVMTTDVENYPGFSKNIQGPWLMEEMKAQALKVGTQMIAEDIKRVDFSQRPFICWGEEDHIYEFDTVIIATGAAARWLEIPGEKEYLGFGVSGCATCDGFFFKDKQVAVVGGGNTAVEDALFLTRFCSKVVLIHRRNQLRAEKIAQDRLFNNPKIRIIWDTVVEATHGTAAPKTVTGLELRSLKTNTISWLETDGLFVAIGYNPMTNLFKGKIALDEEGYIICKPDSTQTSVAGVFAAGDVRDKIFRQAITAAGNGCMAALEADSFLNVNEL